MKYKDKQRKLQVQKLLYKHPELFNYDNGGGRYEKYESLIFVLLNGLNNLYPSIQTDVVSYFKKNNIAWWGDDKKYPSGHLLSSQVQCLNFLFALRKDQNAALRLAQLFDETIDAVLHVPGDNEPAFISFEFVFDNRNLLNEDDWNSQRGEYCTSIDAFMIVIRNEKKVLLPIEWKFTESYLNPENKALEAAKGKERQSRYNKLIEDSDQLKTPVDLANSIYYFEPYYELMRQTLLVEQMVRNGVADDYQHFLIVPDSNIELLQKSFKCNSMDILQVWGNQLFSTNKFKHIDSSDILNLIKQLPNYSELYNYLKLRYS
jgi:hypothetical protein